MSNSSRSAIWKFIAKTKIPFGTGHSVGDLFELVSQLGSKEIGLVETIVRQIVEDQFERPDFYRGLWGRRYGAYSNLIFPSAVVDGIELHMSGTASITCSSTIALDLMNFLSEWPEENHESRDLIRNSLRHYFEFLRNNSGPNGGFGIYHNTNAGIELVEDVRHTVWAVIFLEKYKNIEPNRDVEIDKLIERGLIYVERNLDFSNYEQYRLHTICALHRAKCMNLLFKFNSKTKEGLSQSILEEEIVSRFREADNLWDFSHSPHIKKIDNTLDVVKFLDPHVIKSEKLVTIIRSSINHIFEHYSIPVGADGAGIPLFMGEPAPDVGATALLVSQANKFGIDIDTSQYRNFVRDSYTKSEFGNHAYSWHVSCLIEPQEHNQFFETTNI